MSKETRMQKFERSTGLCVSIAHNDEENAARIQLILALWLAGVHIQTSPRFTDCWEPVYDLPTDFASCRYRKSQ